MPREALDVLPKLGVGDNVPLEHSTSISVDAWKAEDGGVRTPGCSLLKDSEVSPERGHREMERCEPKEVTWSNSRE